MSNLMKNIALLAGGAMLGAAAVMLLAPKAGEEVRNQLADLASEARKRAQEYCDQAKENIAAEAAKVQSQTEEV